MLRPYLTLTACSFLTACPLFADGEVDSLIEELLTVNESSVGYSAYFSGSSFLPYTDAEQLGTFVIGGTHRSESDTLRQIVVKGVDAIPALLKHLSDERKTALEPLSVSGMMWMDFPDEYDYNTRTRLDAPPGVNRDTFGSDEPQPDSHAITVGDLCFVAIGQIVNRNYAAARYQPTGGIIVNSPTYSKRLRDVLIADWSDSTVEKHRRLLVEDFEKPDHEDRRIGAYRRLSFYYPDAVEPLVLRALEPPTFDTFKIEIFCRDILYRSEPKGWKQLYDTFVRENGSHYAVGVMDQLFDDLYMLEVLEEGGISPPFHTQPRELLIQLFDKPDSIKSIDRPPRNEMSDSERARFIASLTHDKSNSVGAVVKQIYIKHPEDDYLAPACLKCLANRGDEQFLLEQLNRIDYSTSEVNSLYKGYLEAIATSKSPIVRERLRRVINETVNDTYFIQSLSGLGLANVDDALVWDNATRILRALPKDTDSGRGILELIVQRFPTKAEETFRSFLSTGSARRAESMCRVLWDGHPLAPKILAPLLDDQRELSGFSMSMRVCDRAAQAISHTADEITFDSEWPQETKDATILKLKEYCANRQ